MSEIRQRWRVVFARDEEARYLSHLDAVTLWERALRRGGVPVSTTEGFSPRPKLIFAAPLQLGMVAEHELADLYLAERLTAPQLRSCLTAGIPAGYRILEVHDVWVGATALAPQLVAADYRLTLLGAECAATTRAAAELMAAATLPRVRRRENRTIAYDLRPLLIELAVREPRSAVGAAAELWLRLRHSQDRGSGRPDEVVAAIAERIGMAIAALPDGELAEDSTQDAPAGDARKTDRGLSAPPDEAGLERPSAAIEITQPVRERLWLAGEVQLD